MLVFGLGYDSVFWARINRGGLTVFLEDNEIWLRNITRKSKLIRAFAVTYGTKVKDWRKYLDDPAMNHMDLPQIVADQRWDIILVDAPEGWSGDTPGRMKSIYLASKLVKPGGDVFVHDCNRQVEDAFCNKFLGAKNLVVECKSVEGFLRHYRMGAPA